MTTTLRRRPPPDAANVPVPPPQRRRGGHVRRPGAPRTVSSRSRCGFGVATRLGDLGLGPDRGHVEQRSGAGRAVRTGSILQIDAGVCRRLNGQSCEFNGVVRSDDPRGDQRLGQPARLDRRDRRRLQRPAGATSPNDVELTLNTLRNDGVQHVLWVNLHDVQPEFAAKNAVLAAAAQHHPELRVLDWNSYSAAHPEWFQTDFIHLRPAGGLAIATWIHQAIADTLAPPTSPPPHALRRSSSPRRSWSGTSASASIIAFAPAAEQRRCAGGQRESRCRRPGSICWREAS